MIKNVYHCVEATIDFDLNDVWQVRVWRNQEDLTWRVHTDIVAYLKANRDKKTYDEITALLEYVASFAQVNAVQARDKAAGLGLMLYTVPF